MWFWFYILYYESSVTFCSFKLRCYLVLTPWNLYVINNLDGKEWGSVPTSSFAFEITLSKYSTSSCVNGRPRIWGERQEDVELEPILSILHKKILPKNEKQSTMDFDFLIPKCPPMIRRNKSTVRHRNSTFESLCSWPCGWIVTVRKGRSTGTCLSQRWLERRK